MSKTKLISSAAMVGLLSSLVSGQMNTAEARDLSWSAGAIGIIGPRYEGSKSYKMFGFPILYPRFTGGGVSTFSKRVSFKRVDDIRFSLFDVNDFQAGPVLGFRGGRDESDGVLLGGLGDIDPGLVVGGYAAYRFDWITFDASLGTQVFGDSTGFQARFAAETEYEVNSQFKLTARVGTTLSGDDYMDTFFGVTAAQSAASAAGLPVYDPDGGIKDVFFKLGTEFQFNDNWRFGASGRYTRLLGDAADSPVIETKNQFSGNLRLIYDF